MYQLSEQIMMTWIGTFVWAFMRVYIVLMIMLVVGSRAVPENYRVLLAVLLSWALMPIIPPVSGIELLSLESIIVSGQQLLIGVFIGFTLLLVAAAVTFAGEAIAFAMGLGFASMVDPQNGNNTPVISQIFVITSTLIFLSLNGHIIVIGLIADSFVSMPIGVVGMGREEYWLMIKWSSRIFVVGLMIALPAIASIMLMNIGLGVITKVAQQLNIFSIGFAINIFFGLFIIISILPVAMNAYMDFFMEGVRVIQELTSP